STFPSYMSIRSNNLMEEKRTFYVALTRAKKRLYITSNIGDSYGRKGEISRFIKLIPREYIKNI
ncbi:3'-5' exonuclease, partial [Clostridium sp.]|uniref:3'-5' exonuclease n=1 Tax=Clostridium sp. TaxID=1506 RepID=UPI003F33A65C